MTLSVHYTTLYTVELFWLMCVYFSCSEIRVNQIADWMEKQEEVCIFPLLNITDIALCMFTEVGG